MTKMPIKLNNRSGFTLLELLMVVAVIGVLMTLTISVMSGITTQAQEEATKTTVLKISRLVDQRVQAYDKAFKGSRRQQYITGTIGFLKAENAQFEYFNQHPDEAPPALVMLAKKAGLRFELPQRMLERTASGDAAAIAGEATNTFSPDPEPGYVLPDLPASIYQAVAAPLARRQLIEASQPVTAASVLQKATENWRKHTSDTESAELLYFILTQSGTFGASTVISEQFTTSEIADTDGDGLPEFVDAWGQPFRFYRWPTRLFDPTAPNPFLPSFTALNDNTEVDPTPDGNESDGLREVTKLERDYASLLVKGLPPTPQRVGNATQRDLMLVDPDDPVGLLYTFIEDPKYINMGITLTNEYNESKYHTPDTYHVPLIVSAGGDGELGLREPVEVNAASGIFGNLAQYAGTTTSSPQPSAAVYDQLVDNITSRNRRAGGRR